MDADILSLLACPRCGGPLDDRLRCRDCGESYKEADGIADLRLPGDARTERVRDFYAQTPFPGYPPRDSIDWLRTRAERSRFARMLDAAIPYDARVVEMGCGTGQMSLYLARGGRTVIAADLCRASLKLGATAARRLGISGVHFVETDVHHPGLRSGMFDIVYCLGVLHHTPDPGEAFSHMAKLARPGGLVIVGLYNSYARFPHRVRRFIARSSGWRWVPHDPVLHDRRKQPERYEAWLRDQYRHPEEHRHTLAEVRRWFAGNQIDYIRAVPSALIGGAEEQQGLTDAEAGGWWLEDVLAQLGWTRLLAREGGLFVTIGRATATGGVAGRGADDLTMLSGSSCSSRLLPSEQENIGRTKYGACP